MTTHYELLGVAPDATSQQLRQAFRALSKRYHPDTTSLPAAEAEAAFQQLRLAYGVLGDPVARRSYDERLRQPARPPVVFSTPARPATAAFQPRPTSVRRSLSGGEWFALVLLAVALAFSLVLGVGLAWARGTALMTRPSWWVDPAVVPVLLQSDPAVHGGQPPPPPGQPPPSPGQPIAVLGPSEPPQTRPAPASRPAAPASRPAVPALSQAP